MEDGSAKIKEQAMVRGKDTAWVPAVVIGVVFVLLSYFCTWFFCFRVAPKFKDTVYELGELSVSTDPDDYLTGLPFFHNSFVVDTSKVDTYTVGEYEVTVYSDRNTYSYNIRVCDTTAPEIMVTEENYELNFPYMLYEFADYVYDASGGYDAQLFMDGKVVAESHVDIPSGFEGEKVGAQYDRLIDDCEIKQEILSFPEQKTYELSLVVTDGSGNKTKEDFSINVKDTLPPDIVAYTGEDAPYFATGRMYSVEELVENVSDNSEFFSTAFLDGEETLARISFDDIGKHTFTVYAVDEAGNEVTRNLSAKFDDAPVFVGVRDRKVEVGNDFDISKNIVAIDNTDGNVSSGIEVDDGGFDCNKAGVYSVKYIAHDSHGLETEVVSKVTVGSIDDSGFYLSEEECELLCDYSFFDYDLLDDYDYEATVKLVEPTLVNMIYRFGYNGYNAGSGFIYKINSDYTYIVSCSHVMAGMDDQIEVMFCDEDTTKIYIDAPEFEQLSPENEVCMFRFPTSQIPAEALIGLKEIYCDEDVYGFLATGEELIAYSGHWMNDEPLVRKLYIRDLDSKFLDDAVNCVRTSHNVESGMSGTAVVDECGRLVGIVEGYTTYWDFDIEAYANDGYQLRIDGIEDLYERVSGE